MQKWEYRVVTRKGGVVELEQGEKPGIEGALNKLGDQGWELAGIDPVIRHFSPTGQQEIRDEVRYIFKRLNE